MHVLTLVCVSIVTTTGVLKNSAFHTCLFKIVLNWKTVTFSDSSCVFKYIKWFLSYNYEEQLECHQTFISASNEAEIKKIII